MWPGNLQGAGQVSTICLSRWDRLTPQRVTLTTAGLSASIRRQIFCEQDAREGGPFIGIVFYKQDASGKDVEFINEYQQNIGDKNRMYATQGNELSLPAGTYSVYIIPWGKRETMEHNGNLKEYLRK